MPYQDGTGPEGLGPMTGRGMGPCAQDVAMPRRFGRRMGRGRGVAGFGCRFYQRPLSSVDEKEFLEEDKEILKEELASIEKRLKDLKTSK